MTTFKPSAIDPSVLKAALKDANGPEIDDIKAKALYAEAKRRGLPVPPAIAQRVLAAEAGRRGLASYTTFEDFVKARRPDLLRHQYIRQQIAVAQKVIDGQLSRVLVLLPTQYGKSEIWSRLLPAYYLLRFPSRTVALASYGADLAWELSGDARDHYSGAGGRFQIGSPRGSSRNWKTNALGVGKGGMWATGIGGPALGRGWHLGIVDDPVDPEQAVRRAYQNRFARWWAAKWLRGQRPKTNALIFVMQRLGPDDPVSWLLEREQQGDTAEGWHIIAMDEIKSPEPFARYDGPMGFPKTCTVEPDTRKPGEVLAPEFRSAREVQRLQATAGPIVAAAQRQQRPMRPTGDFWALRWFEDRIYDQLPPDAHDGGWDWDTAYGEDEKNAASAGVKSYRGLGPRDQCPIYIDDCWWDWLKFPELVRHMASVPGPHYVEQKATGKSLVQVLSTYHIVADEVPVKGSKLERAAAAQPAVSGGRVYISRRIWQKLLYGEGQGLLRITAEALDAGQGGLDLNDSFVQALHRQLGLGAGKKKVARFG